MINSCTIHYEKSVMTMALKLSATTTTCNADVYSNHHSHFRVLDYLSTMFKKS